MKLPEVGVIVVPVPGEDLKLIPLVPKHRSNSRTKTPSPRRVHKSASPRRRRTAPAPGITPAAKSKLQPSAVLHGAVLGVITALECPPVPADGGLVGLDAAVTRSQTEPEIVGTNELMKEVKGPVEVSKSSDVSPARETVLTYLKSPTVLIQMENLEAEAVTGKNTPIIALTAQTERTERTLNTLVVLPDALSTCITNVTEVAPSPSLSEVPARDAAPHVEEVTCPNRVMGSPLPCTKMMNNSREGLVPSLSRGGNSNQSTSSSAEKNMGCFLQARVVRQKQSEWRALGERRQPVAGSERDGKMAWDRSSAAREEGSRRREKWGPLDDRVVGEAELGSGGCEEDEVCEVTETRLCKEQGNITANVPRDGLDCERDSFSQELDLGTEILQPEVISLSSSRRVSIERENTHDQTATPVQGKVGAANFQLSETGPYAQGKGSSVNDQRTSEELCRKSDIEHQNDNFQRNDPSLRRRASKERWRKETRFSNESTQLQPTVTTQNSLNDTCNKASSRSSNDHLDDDALSRETCLSLKPVLQRNFCVTREGDRVHSSVEIPEGRSSGDDGKTRARASSDCAQTCPPSEVSEVFVTGRDFSDPGCLELCHSEMTGGGMSSCDYTCKVDVDDGSNKNEKLGVVASRVASGNVTRAPACAVAWSDDLRKPGHQSESGTQGLRVAVTSTEKLVTDIKDDKENKEDNIEFSVHGDLELIDKREVVCGKRVILDNKGSALGRYGQKSSSQVSGVQDIMGDDRDRSVVQQDVIANVSMGTGREQLLQPANGGEILKLVPTKSFSSSIINGSIAAHVVNTKEGRCLYSEDIMLEPRLLIDDAVVSETSDGMTVISETSDVSDEMTGTEMTSVAVKRQDSCRSSNSDAGYGSESDSAASPFREGSADAAGVRSVDTTDAGGMGIVDIADAGCLRSLDTADAGGLRSVDTTDAVGGLTDSLDNEFGAINDERDVQREETEVYGTVVSLTAVNATDANATDANATDANATDADHPSLHSPDLISVVGPSVCSEPNGSVSTSTVSIPTLCAASNVTKNSFCPNTLSASSSSTTSVVTKSSSSLSSPTKPCPTVERSGAPHEPLYRMVAWGPGLPLPRCYCSAGEPCVCSGPASLLLMKRSALQVLHKHCSQARAHCHYQGGLSHDWLPYYERGPASDQSCVNEWNAMAALLSRRPPSPETLTSKEETQLLIRSKLKEIMMNVDIDEVTSKFIRQELEKELVMDLFKYKSYIDQEMLIILGQMDAATEIFQHVYLGSEWNASNLEELKRNGIGFILNVTMEIDNFFPGMFDYKNIRVYDNEKTDLLFHWEDTYRYINMIKERGGKVLVHCKMGISRSASVVIAYAMKAYNLNLAEATELVKKKRSCIKPNNAFSVQLKTYQGILDASRQRHNALWRSKSETNLQQQPQPKTQNKHSKRSSNRHNNTGGAGNNSTSKHKNKTSVHHHHHHNRSNSQKAGSSSHCSTSEGREPSSTDDSCDYSHHHVDGGGVSFSPSHHPHHHHHGGVGYMTSTSASADSFLGMGGGMVPISPNSSPLRQVRSPAPILFSSDPQQQQSPPLPSRRRQRHHNSSSSSSSSDSGSMTAATTTPGTPSSPPPPPPSWHHNDNDVSGIGGGTNTFNSINNNAGGLIGSDGGARDTVIPSQSGSCHLNSYRQHDVAGGEEIDPGSQRNTADVWGRTDVTNGNRCSNPLLSSDDSGEERSSSSGSYHPLYGSNEGRRPKSWSPDDRTAALLFPSTAGTGPDDVFLKGVSSGEHRLSGSLNQPAWRAHVTLHGAAVRDDGEAGRR